MSGDDLAPASPGSVRGDSPAKRFPTVGIGTSAGGINALQTFLESLPDEVDAAFVVIVHLDPEHQSELPSILAARTKMPVAQVTGQTQMEPRHVYVIPPNRQLVMTDMHLALADFDEPRWRRAPIDFFFRSLAATHRGDDIAIILSGAGSDGSVGIKAVKEAGGIIMVQDPDEAQYSSMPRSAIATGLADFVLPLREIAARLPELVNQPRSEPDDGPDSDAMQHVLSHLRVRTGHDFSSYKKSTVRRRIARRMQVQRAGTMADYLTILRENAAEAQALLADLLISVTMFFRDPSAFDKLAAIVIPRLFDDKGAGDPVRVWVPGCATGEEAYSIAILLLEEAARRDLRCEIQVFASDLDEAALAIGREGRYPAAIEVDVATDRLKRFFTRENDNYRVTRELRNALLFAKHSLLKDPPFSRADLISCRNLLIYLDRQLQQQCCSTFHFALKANGYLFLGSSESADLPKGLFHALDRELRIYQHALVPPEIRVAPLIGSPELSVSAFTPRTLAPSRPVNEMAVHREALERLAPPSALVDESFRIVHLSETAGRYFQPSGGTLINDITELAREELRLELRAALQGALARGEARLSGPISVRFNGSAHRVYLQVRPSSADPNAGRSAIVFFLEGDALDSSDGRADALDVRAPREQIQVLQQELHFTQVQLRNSREEYEGANEELRAANEELQPINEEYRSTAVELETSKEELQSINEELQTVNVELKVKLESVSRAHSDIQNLMAATDVGILFLDPQLRIKLFTPGISNLFNLAEGDEGRSITDFTHSLDYDGVARDVRTVLRDLSSTEREVGSRSGSCYLMRMRPYRTVDDKIDGVVVTFVDIGGRRRAEEALRHSETRLRGVVDGVAVSIITIDEAGIVRTANKAATDMFGYPAEELVGLNVKVLAAEPDQSQHDMYIKRYIETGEARIIGVGREVEARRKDGSTFPVELRVSETRHGDERLFIGFVRDLTERRRFEARLSRLHANRLDLMADMATALAHELNQPLAAAANYLFTARHILGAKPDALNDGVDEALDKASSQMHRAGQIIAHLREFMTRGEPDKLEHSLHSLIRRTCELVAPTARQAGVEIVLQLEAPEDKVLADKVQIEQAMVNIVRNAIEAMSDTPERRLTISTTLDESMIRVDFTDTGRGLPTAAEDLFVPFSTTKSNGLGVGLSISRTIIDAHYGALWAEADPGGGAKFCFTLPLAQLESVEPDER